MPNRKVYPFVGTARVHGLVIDIENLKGSVREGNGWKQKMHCHYGEFRKTKGTDGDKLDVYIGPKPKSKRIFVVHQNFPGNHAKAGKYDEDKVMLGFESPEEAKAAYMKQYSRKDFFRSMTEMTMPQFKKLIFGEAKGEKVATELCKTPGKKIRSRGQGRGKAYGEGRGPRGIALGDKLREFSKTRKKDKRPSEFIRQKIKTGSLKDAYTEGVKLALGQALTTDVVPIKALAPAKPLPFASEKPTDLQSASLKKGAPPASAEGTSSGALQT